MSVSRLPRLTRFLRSMHTEGRQIDRQGPSTSPQSHTHIPPSVNAVHPPIPTPEIIDTSPFVESSRPTHTSKGKSIPRRPARQIPVSLPNGDPEPPSYPPPKEYFDTLEENRQAKHPLWQFFHVPSTGVGRLKEDAAPPQSMGSLETLLNEAENLHSGRSWTAAELRQKSFKDLHTLWYVLLKERNVLATQKEERRRLNIGQRVDGDLITKRAFRCRKTMARIKYVLNERRLGLIAAAGPQLVRQVEPTFVPWSASATTDPAGATAAIRGEIEAPLRVLRGKVRKGRAAAAGAADESFIEDEVVNEEEVESRDEGFGGGKEAEEFVKEVEVKEDGKVEKKD
ncbi:hypothetical protein I317_01526 [Kwoniella heveanensis CBS 569]|uniref:Large ribosomal subunit protein uL29m n=1 Tax=Kwoniella heveanensis BCC8398 TaxID=1296120 RepID=A0A1B9H4A8_9TREE|nr:hypothetical protein I316_00329 [Kwoniella heveanensis BCC8398]OCF44639.1 hypothetical protein I317_01526 [Kwoniella heveanensis CBS 569]